MFKNSTYQVTEGDGSAQSVLILSNPSSIDISVKVTSEDRSATGIPILCIQYTVQLEGNLMPECG